MNNRCQTCGVLVEDDSTKCSRCHNSASQVQPSFRALFYVFDGLIILFKNVRLLKLSLIPLVITFFLIICTYAGSFFLLFQGIETFLPSNESSSTILNVSRYGLAFLGSTVLLIISFFLFLPLSSLVCIPFNDIVSIETERILLGDNLNNENQNSLSEIKVGLKEVFKLLTLKVIVILICLPILIIPIVGQTLFFFILAMVTAIDFLDIIMARKRYFLSEKLLFVKKNFLGFILFSLPLVLLFWIPIIQLLIIPCYAIGGTKFFIESNKS